MFMRMLTITEHLYIVFIIYCSSTCGFHGFFVDCCTKVFNPPLVIIMSHWEWRKPIFRPCRYTLPYHSWEQVVHTQSFVLMKIIASVNYQRWAIQREFEPIGSTLLKNPLDARCGLLPNLRWVGSWLPTYLASFCFVK
jgi:hypothetical protein